MCAPRSKDPGLAERVRCSQAIKDLEWKQLQYCSQFSVPVSAVNRSAVLCLGERENNNRQIKGGGRGGIGEGYFVARCCQFPPTPSPTQNPRFAESPDRKNRQTEKERTWTRTHT